MSTALRRPWTIGEFLDWEERQEGRFEFDGFQPIAMVGGTINHNLVVLNVAALLRDRLKGTPCRVVAESVKVEVAGKIRYPDVVVTCAPVAGQATILPDPVVIFEILSDSTAQTDRTEKNAEYRDTPSIVRYLMLEQDICRATMFAREGARWVGSLLGADAVVAMPEIGVELPLADAYEGVDFLPGPTVSE